MRSIRSIIGFGRHVINSLPGHNARPVVIKFSSTLVSPGLLLKVQMLEPYSRFTRQLVWGKLCIPVPDKLASCCNVHTPVRITGLDHREIIKKKKNDGKDAKHKVRNSNR